MTTERIKLSVYKNKSKNGILCGFYEKSNKKQTLWGKCFEMLIKSTNFTNKNADET